MYYYFDLNADDVPPITLGTVLCNSKKYNENPIIIKSFTTSLFRIYLFILLYVVLVWNIQITLFFNL